MRVLRETSHQFSLTHRHPAISELLDQQHNVSSPHPLRIADACTWHHLTNVGIYVDEVEAICWHQEAGGSVLKRAVGS